MGRVRIGLGSLLALGGLGLILTGAVIDARAHPDVEAEAISTARTGGDGVMEVDASEAGAYTIYVVSRVHDLFEEDGAKVQQDAVHDTRCTIERPGREVLRLRGDRQGNGQSTDDVASVGWFSTGAGAVRVDCTSRSGDDREVLLVPGKPSIWAGGTVIALVGALALLLGLGMVWWGARSRRPDGSSDTVGGWT